MNMARIMPMCKQHQDLRVTPLDAYRRAFVPDSAVLVIPAALSCGCERYVTTSMKEMS